MKDKFTSICRGWVIIDTGEHWMYWWQWNWLQRGFTSLDSTSWFFSFLIFFFKILNLCFSIFTCRSHHYIVHIVYWFPSQSRLWAVHSIWWSWRLPWARGEETSRKRVWIPRFWIWVNKPKQKTKTNKNIEIKTKNIKRQVWLCRSASFWWRVRVLACSFENQVHIGWYGTWCSGITDFTGD